MPPLWAAVRGQKLDNVVFLLARGARISDASALALAASLACPVVLQALIDAGCDVNWLCDGVPVLLFAVWSRCDASVRALLAQPQTNVDVTRSGVTVDAEARQDGAAALADMIAGEVSLLCVFCLFGCAHARRSGGCAVGVP